MTRTSDSPRLKNATDGAENCASEASPAWSLTALYRPDQYLRDRSAVTRSGTVTLVTVAIEPLVGAEGVGRCQM